MTAPLAVVVPTRNRAGNLERLVASLAAQTVAADLEVVFVDDRSTDGTTAVLAAAIREHGLRATVIRTAPRRPDAGAGPAVARNAGWRATSAALVAFLDDDCRPDPGWARALRDALGGADVVQGRTVPDPDDAGHRGPFSHTVSIERFTDRFETCNIGYRRTILTAVGGFDETFRHPYGEDVDLGWRAVEAGATTCFAGDAVVFHRIEASDPLRSLRRARRIAEMARVVHRHPGYRRHLHAGVFTDASHAWAVVAAAGLVAAGTSRQPSPLVATVPYLVHRALIAPLWQRWKSPVTIPVALAIDLAETAVLARASVRQRTLVL